MEEIRAALAPWYPYVKAFLHVTEPIVVVMVPLLFVLAIAKPF